MSADYADVVVPNSGLASGELALLRWRKEVGDAVTAGEALAEMETDKATVEIESSANGSLVAVFAEPGSVLAIGQVIARILKSGGT
jgi:pyruvate/2-oxoglutarate dehydrogenase complex dihydrolipoamide acyltransferase (E2) component